MKKLLLFLGGCMWIGQSQAQQLLGLTGSNYSGTHGIFMNPSSIANSRMGFYLDLVSVQAGATNNYLKGPLGFGAFSELSKESLVRNNSGSSKFVNVQGQAQAFSFMFKMSPVHSVALTNRVRYGISGNNISPELANVLWEGGDLEDMTDKTYQNMRFNINADAYKETGLTYARVIKNSPDYVLKGGITINRIHGITSAHIASKDLNFSTYKQTNEVGDPELILDIQKLNMQYAYVKSEAYEDAIDNIGAGTVFGKGLPGKGWGVNLGATFEKPEAQRQAKEGKKLIDSLRAVHKKDVAKVNAGSGSKMENAYKYRLGVSLMDIGGIRYKGDYAQRYDVSRTNKQISVDSLGGSTDDMISVINNGLGVTEAEAKNQFTAGLPTALQVNFDYHLKGKLYVNAVWVQNLRGKYAFGMRQASLLAVTPRLEMRWFEIALPVALMGNYRNLTIGTHVKAGIFHFGSDNLAGLMGMGKTYGLDVYTGVHIPVFARNKQAKAAKATSTEGVPARQ